MNTANLALRQTPPLSVPVRFFITAPLFGILASLFLIYTGPTILSSRWGLNALAITHLLTLGFVSMVMFGAILQLLPVVAGTVIPHPVLVSSIIHLLLTLGSLSLTIGFVTGQNFLLRTAVFLLGLSFLSFVSIIEYYLIQVKGNIIVGMILALIALLITAGLGILLALRYAYGITLPLPMVLANIHLTWGLVGWVGLLIIAIAYQVVPMFQITPQYNSKLMRWLIPTLFIILLLWTLAYIWLSGHDRFYIVNWITLIIALGLAIFGCMTLYLQLQRLRKIPDVTLNFWRVGIIGLLLSICLWIIGIGWPELANQPLYPLLLFVLFVGGFVLMVIQGMLYKIIPFLIWLHLHNQQLNPLKTINMVRIPHMKQIISLKQAQYQFWAYITAMFCIILALFFPSLIYIAGIVLLSSFALLEYNLFKALLLYRSFL
ncbi:hypothetical protein QUF74_04560 [Candidatus Halobeggiatoa sp. HSG11]|nr:hypothetical protein [Candidatus Halobeggiatoa sp. HSG11]